MFKLARFRESLGDGRATYASVAMHWIGTKLILNGKDYGMPGDFWWDQEDRAVLKGGEVSDPRYQRLQTRTDDFRRYLRDGVGRLMPFAIPLLAAPLLIAGILIVKVFGPDLGPYADARPGIEEVAP